VKLLTKADLKRLPPLYSQSEKDPKDVLVPVKFFNPGGAGSWFATEFDPVERLRNPVALGRIQEREQACAGALVGLHREL